MLIPLDPADLESVFLEETPKQASRPPNSVQQAWEQEGQQQMWVLNEIKNLHFSYQNENWGFLLWFKTPLNK